MSNHKRGVANQAADCFKVCRWGEGLCNSQEAAQLGCSLVDKLKATRETF